MSMASRNVKLFTLAGIYTAPNFLDEFRETVADSLRGSGFDVHSRSVFPYGDWSRSKVRQAAEIACDLFVPAIGGRRALQELDAGQPAVLIGHSGGGVAAVRAAAELMRAGDEVGAVVMIGSPRIPIPRALRDRTLFLYACSRAGDAVDRVTRLGGWRGRPPERIAGLPLIGGHPDYFRARPPFVNAEGRSNLDVTTEALLPWLIQRLER